MSGLRCASDYNTMDAIKILISSQTPNILLYYLIYRCYEWNAVRAFQAFMYVKSIARHTERRIFTCGVLSSSTDVHFSNGETIRCS